MAQVKWAYQFDSDNSLYQMEPLLNSSGSWRWRVRDCAWYPDYLECCPQNGIRICIYELNPPGGPTYRSMVKIEDSSFIDRSAIEPAFLTLLQSAGAKNHSEIQADEWPFD